MTHLVKHQIEDLIAQAIGSAQKAGQLPAFPMPPISAVHPEKPELGDYAVAIALRLGRSAGMLPLRIAEIIVNHLPSAPFIGSVTVAPPGFINITLSPTWLCAQVDEIIAAGESFGCVDLGKGQRVQVEYVSANPTGPITIASGRNAVLGDTLANILAAAGYDVYREYYINDTGSQMAKFNATLYARYMQLLGWDEPVPEDGYQGAYMIEYARRVIEQVGDRFASLDRERAITEIGAVGLEIVLASLKEDLALIGVHFDNWFSERSLYTSGLFDRVLAMLIERGYTYEADGALWFTTTRFGEKKDDVIIRSEEKGGMPGYFASDIAYHYNKLVERGFDLAINVWGADHHGDVPRLKAVLRALGIDPNRLQILLYQMVTVNRSGEQVRMSKRKGDIITLREVVEDVGPDAVRFFLLARSADVRIDFDLDLAKRESNENPVYYVQYGHARIASILRYAGDIDSSNGDVQLLTTPPEQTLIRTMLELPEVVETAALNLEPHHLAHFAQDLASVFHAFYKECRVVSSDPADLPLTKARLKLVRAAKIALANCLRLMGMSAPEQM